VDAEELLKKYPKEEVVHLEVILAELQEVIPVDLQEVIPAELQEVIPVE
jgi:hypothetical protein